MFSKHRLCIKKPVTLPEPCIQLIIQVYVLKTQAGTEKHVTLSEPCIQPITQVWTMQTAHYKGLCSENTGYVLRNKSHCLNHADSLSYRYMFSKHWLCTEKPVTLSVHTTHYKGLCSHTGYVLRNQSHCLNHAYSSLYRYMAIIQVYVLKTQVLRNQSHCLNHHAYNSLYRSMFWKHRLCRVTPVTLHRSEPCI